LPPELEIRDWLPQEPWQGPPLPELLNIYWPWYTPPGAEFSVSDLVIEPTEVNPGQPVTISCAVTNIGSEAGPYTVHLEGDFMAEQSVTLQPSESKVVSFEATPHEAKVYQVSVDGLSGSFKVIEAIPELITFSVEVYNIPSYAAGSYQWFISYGGKNHGMIDPQAGIWTPISKPIDLVDVPPSGALQATLHAGPFQSWEFPTSRTFRDGETYRFNLSAGIIEGPGIVLTGLVVEPDFLTLGESVTLSVMATNTGQVDEQREVIFTVEDTEAGSVTVQLGPQESKEVSIEITPSEVGVYFAKVEALTARFEVKEFYPDISQPEVVSIEWTKIDYVYGCKFKGTILLPGPLAKGQVQGITAWLEPKGNMAGWLGGVTPTYLSEGLWSFTGGVGFPRFSPHQLCDSGLVDIAWFAQCPVCYQPNVYQGWAVDEHWYPEEYKVGEAKVKEMFMAHVGRWCSRGVTEREKAHCTLRVADAIITREERPVMYLTAWPCVGTRLTLLFNVAIYAPTGGDPPYSLVREWKINTGLTYTVK